LTSRYKIRENAWVLDIGCGTGYYTYLLARLNLRVMGVDLSRIAILKAKQTWRDHYIDWIICDACNMPIKEKFDVIFCSGFSLFNVPDLTTCTSLAEKLLEHLKPGGLFIYVESSNLSEAPTTVANHSLQQVYNFFLSLKSLKDVEIYAVNVRFFLIFGGKTLSSFVTKLTSKLLKIHRRSCRIICVSRKSEKRTAL
jgi:SAM-dependent methyltransferase